MARGLGTPGLEHNLDAKDFASFHQGTWELNPIKLNNCTDSLTVIPNLKYGCPYGGIAIFISSKRCVTVLPPFSLIHSHWLLKFKIQC